MTLPPAKIRIGVRVAMDPFGDPFAMLRPRVLERETKPMTLKILPIPGRPDFKGPVGQFGVAATVDRKSIPAGEAVTLKVRLAGSGNLRTATEAPHLSIPGVKVYPPSSRTLPARGAAKGGTSAEWDFVVVPSEPGSLVIPPISLEVFDTAEKKLVVKRSEPITLTVEAAAPLAVASAGDGCGRPRRGRKRLRGVDDPSGRSRRLPPLSPRRATSRRRRSPFPSGRSSPLPVSSSRPAGRPGPSGAGLTPSAPRAPSSLAEPGETKERAVARVERAIREHLARRTGASETAPVSALLDDLADRGVPPALREELRQLLSQADFLRFAPQLGDYADEITRLREKARTVLGRVRGTGRA